MPGIAIGNLALLTDLYQLTMAYGYWKSGMAERQAVFHLFFRRPPFSGGYAVTAGLETAIDFLNAFHFDDSDIEYLRTLCGNNGQPLFSDDFLDYLRNLKFSCDVDGMPEGTLAFGNEPILRVEGPILQCQLVETALLNIVNFQTLIATKSARVCLAAGGDEVLEFGLRRAQGIDGGMSASRAAYIGGCTATSNVLAGKRYGIPVRGTHAHSWVMSFDSEMESFEQYAEVMPNNCVFLVDTYDTLEGVDKAIQVGNRLRTRGHEMIGIRLDSGDLAYLSHQARRKLDEAGFPAAKIVASNDLNEVLIESLKNQGAKIAVWGVGTQLATAYDQPALGGVYKLAALKDENGNWHRKIKLSEQVIKTSIPGRLQVRRFSNDNAFCGDMIWDTLSELKSNTIVDAKDPTREKDFGAAESCTDILVPLFRKGQLDRPLDSLDVIRQRVQEQLGQLHSGVKRFLNPHEYPVGLEKDLSALRNEMIKNARRHQKLPIENSPRNSGEAAS